MMIAFLNFEDETILAMGFTAEDIVRMSKGNEPPLIDIAAMAIDLGSPLPSRIAIMIGNNEQEMSVRIQEAFGERGFDPGDLTPLSDDVSDKYTDNGVDESVLDNPAEAEAMKRAAEKLWDSE